MLGQCASQWKGGTTVLHKKMVIGGTLLKSCKCSWIFRKIIFLESVSFHHEMFDVTNFRLFLGVYIVHVVFFIQKNLVNLFRISFVNC